MSDLDEPAPIDPRTRETLALYGAMLPLDLRDRIQAHRRETRAVLDDPARRDDVDALRARLRAFGEIMGEVRTYVHQHVPAWPEEAR